MNGSFYVCLVHMYKNAHAKYTFQPIILYYSHIQAAKIHQKKLSQQKLERKKSQVKMDVNKASFKMFKG